MTRKHSYPRFLLCTTADGGLLWHCHTVLTPTALISSPNHNHSRKAGPEVVQRNLITGLKLSLLHRHSICFVLELQKFQKGGKNQTCPYSFLVNTSKVSQDLGSNLSIPWLNASERGLGKNYSLRPIKVWVVLVGLLLVSLQIWCKSFCEKDPLAGVSPPGQEHNEKGWFFERHLSSAWDLSETPLSCEQA